MDTQIMDIMTDPNLPTSAEAPDAPVTRDKTNHTELLLFRLNDRAVLRLSDFGYVAHIEDAETGRYRPMRPEVGFYPGRASSKSELRSLLNREGIEPTEEAARLLETVPERFDFAASAAANARRLHEPRPRPEWLHEDTLPRRRQKGA